MEPSGPIFSSKIFSLSIKLKQIHKLLTFWTRIRGFLQIPVFICVQFIYFFKRKSKSKREIKRIQFLNQKKNL